MDKKYSIDDILTELESKKSEVRVESDELSRILDDILGKSSKNTREKNESTSSEKQQQAVKSQAPAQQDAHACETEKPTEKAPEVEKPTEKATEVEKTEAVFEEKTEQDGKIGTFVPDKRAFEDETIRMEPFGLDANIPVDCVQDTGAVNSDLIEFRESRKQKVEKFVLFGEEEEDNDPEPEQEEAVKSVEIIDDFNNYSESTAIAKDISGIKAGLTLRVTALLILTAISGYIEFASSLRLPVIDIFSKASNPLSYLIVSALVFAVAVLISAPAVFGGFSSLLRFKADGDSLLAVSVLGGFAQFAALFASPQYVIKAGATIVMYSFVVIINLLCNALGKLLIIKRVRLNFRFVSGGYEKCALTFPENEKLNSFVRERFNASYAGVAVPRKTNFIKGFLSNSYKEDMSDTASKVIAPLIGIGAVVLSAVNYFFARDIQRAVCSFAAITAICAPVSAMLSVNFPMFRAVKKIISRGSMISGMNACNEVYDTNSILIKSAELFPKGSIQLSAIKTFAAGKIDDVILDAASVVITAQSDLSDVFLSVIGGRKDLLRTVDSIVYEESMGLSAWVDSKRVLIGNRELIRHHGIDVPSKDYENRYLDNGTDMVYLAESGQLVAVFLIQYKPGTQVKKSMKALSRLGVGVIVASTDPNINAEKIARIFDIEEEMVVTVPAEKQGEIEKLTHPSDGEHVGTASIASFSSVVQTLYAAIRLKGITSLAVAIQSVGVILGFAVMIFFIFVSGEALLSVGAILLYQCFWLAASLVVPMFRRIKL